MNVNPYIADLDRRNEEVAIVEDKLKQLIEDLAHLNGEADPCDEKLLAARAHLEACKKFAAIARSKVDAAQKALRDWDANPKSVKQHSALTYTLIGAGVVGLAASGAGALWAAVALGEVAVTAVVGAIAGATMGGGLGAAVANESNKQERQSSHEASTAERSQLIRGVDDAKAALNEAIGERTNAQAAVSQLEKDLISTRERRTSLDRAEVEANLASVERELSVAYERRAEVQSKFDRLEAKIGPLRRKIDEHDSILDRLIRDHDIALRMDNDLNAPGARKRHIHEECRNYFRDIVPERVDSRPGTIADLLLKKIASEKRSRSKLEEEVEMLSRVHRIGIRRVVFDGSNLCYSVAGKFIGLDALKAAVNAVRAEEWSVVVVFDPKIRSQLKIFRKQSIDELRGSNVEIIVAPLGTRADEIVLGQVRDAHSVAVSNDQFQEHREFPDRYPAISDCRVFSHTIVAPIGEGIGQIEIKALGVFATWP